MDYKIISRIINNRLKNFLPDIMALHNQVFVKGKWIIDNVVTFQDLTSKAKRANKYKDGVATLIDFHKAFDSISHPALYKAMAHFGFHDSFINLIKEMFMGSIAKVLVNGCTTGPISI